MSEKATIEQNWFKRGEREGGITQIKNMHIFIWNDNLDSIWSNFVPIWLAYMSGGLGKAQNGKAQNGNAQNGKRKMCYQENNK